jgi:hypothetical protein
MIITIDLSAPRKISYNAINGLIFDLKMKKQLVNRYRNATLLAIVSLAIKNGSFLIADSAALGSKFNIYNMGKFIELYGIPTCYYKIELMKVKDSIFQSLGVIRARGTDNFKLFINNADIENKDYIFQRQDSKKTL